MLLYFTTSWHSFLCGPIKWQANLYLLEIGALRMMLQILLYCISKSKRFVMGLRSEIGIIHNFYAHKCLHVENEKPDRHSKTISLGDNKIKSHHIFYPDYRMLLIFSLSQLIYGPRQSNFVKIMLTFLLYMITRDFL